MLNLVETQKRIRRLNFFRLIFFISLFMAFLYILFTVKGVFLSFLLAFIISFIFKPPTNFLSRRLGLPRTLSAALVFLSALSGIVALFTWASPFLYEQIISFQKELPFYINKFSLLMETWQQKIATYFPMVNDFNMPEKIKQFLQSFGKSFLGELPENASQYFTILFLAPFVGFIFMKSELGVVRRLYPFVPNNLFDMLLGVHYKINKQVEAFIRGRVLEAIIVGCLIFLGLFLMDFPYAALLSSFAGLMNLIPYLGPVIGSFPVILVALVQDYDVTQIALVVGLFFFVQFIDATLLVPVLLARIVNLHPITVVVIIMAGAQFMGILGMVISIPLVNALKVSLIAIYQHVSDNI